MAIFTRRNLQIMLDENAAFLSCNQLQAHVNFLNAQGVELERYLSYEWEVAVLNAFSKIGRVQHEMNFGGVRQPDLYFSQVDERKINALINNVLPEVMREADNGISEAVTEDDVEAEKSEFTFVADIATVSDTGLHERNPVDAFQEEFIRTLKKHRLSHGFYYQIGSYSSREFAQHRTKIKLPPKNRLGPTIFLTAKFKDFLSGVKLAPSQTRKVDFKDSYIDLTITYDPKSRGLGGGYPNYRSINRFDFDPKERNPFDNNLTHNGLYRALKSKSRQLGGAGFAGRRGIIVCDGGCHLLTNTERMQTRSSNEVVRKFLRESSTVDFIVTVGITMAQHPPRSSTGILTSYLMNSPLSDRVPQVQTWLDMNSRLSESADGANFTKKLAAVISAVHLCFPNPVLNADNAYHWLKGKNGNIGRSGINFQFKGGLDMNPTEVSFSSRALLEVLAGKKDLQEFLQNYGLAPSNDPSNLRQSCANPFEQAFKAGRLICETSIEHLDGKDDDRITFRFGERDAAIAPFQMPSNCDVESLVPEEE